ncbi:hypothetical protein EXIGLDRAFT_771413 [Exidia glandulosa HHB12029]|uniref:WW domain-containing protein n=1 Tax=Exidia glandulosa HHB12029 TaxID=1314781 RepID=A0A165G0R9_EXIGL|nr:hypothetical protein EXIGLDRAFT_771413 [Exidia glandulosa HHB12029]
MALRTQPVRVNAEKYTPSSADLPRNFDYSHMSSCPFSPQPDSEPPSSEWVKFIHPNGTVYWYNQGRSAILANHAYDFTDKSQNTRLVEAIEYLWDGVHPDPNLVSPMTASTSVEPDVRSDYELFVDIDHKSPESPVKYYFVDWSSRTVFWRKPQSLFKAISDAHLADILTTQFWIHVAAYPMHHALPSRSREELFSIIGYNMIDSIQSPASTAPWTRQDMRLILSSLKQDSGRSMDSEPHYLSEETKISNAGVARLWCEICDIRATNFYGDKRAKVSRLERHSRDKEPGHYALARTICSLIFLNRPHRLETDLKELFADGTLYRIHWRTYVEEEIEPEWQQQGTLATIMLAANMAFLALDSVEKANDGPFLACKTLSLSSTTFSVAALFATLKLARTHHKLKSATTEEASEYMTYCSSRMLGLFGLAVVYSIPFTMFMWSLFTFVAAVLLYAFQHWTRDAGLPLIAATVVPIVALLGWEWWFFEGRSWKDTTGPSDSSMPPTVSNTTVASPGPAIELAERTPSSGLLSPLQLPPLSYLRGRSRSNDTEKYASSKMSP